MSVRTKYIASFALVIFFLAFIVYGQGGWSLKKLYDIEKIIPLPIDRDEAKLSLYLNRGSVDDYGRLSETLRTNESKLKVPEQGAYLSIDSQEDDFNKLETLSGKFAILQKYVFWGEPKSSFDSTLATKLWLDDKILLISWNPSKSYRKNPIDQTDYRLKKILEGKYDAYIKKWAGSIKKWKRPVIIRFAPEMNGDWLPWGTLFTTPREYAQTYRYVVNIFRDKQVKNVSWMWSPNEAMGENITNYYPGDEYVDWVGLSGFNWGGLEKSNRWRTFEEIYGKSLEQIKGINKPVALAEFGSVEDESDPQGKGKWILNSLSIIRQKYPHIKLVNWTNEKSFGIYDWRINTSSYSLESFANAVADNYYLSVVQKVDV